MEEVLDIYKTPYNLKRPVICLDESSKQLIKEIREPLPQRPGSIQKYDSEYERHGTSNVFMAFEPLTGFRITEVTEQRTKTDWACFIKKLVDDECYQDVDKIVLIMDNLNTHNKASLYEKFEPSEAKRIADKLEIHYTPKHGSWLNIAEIELSILSRQCLNRRMGDKRLLAREVTAWTETRNRKRAAVDWQFTTADARIKLRRLYPSIQV
jgi:DDE superfamily endonuclease